MLSFLPEALDYWTKRSSSSSPFSSPDSVALRSTASSSSQVVDRKRANARSVVTLKMEMGCVSCVKAVLDHLEAAADVVDAKVHFERGEAEVWFAEEVESDALRLATETIKTLLDDGGFKPSMVSTQPSEHAAAIARARA